MAKKSKFIKDADDIKREKQLAEFMQKINPKPPKEEIERLKKMHLDLRNLPY